MQSASSVVLLYLLILSSFKTDNGKEEATATQAQTDFPHWATATKPYYVRAIFICSTNI